MSDFENEFKDEFHDESNIALEKGAYSRFYIGYNVRRPTQAPGKFDIWSKLQLPNQSVLHTLNGFDTLVPPSDGMPDPSLPVVLNEKFPIYLKINTQMGNEDSKPFGISENYIYRPNTLMPQITHFFQHHRRYHRILSDRTLASMQGVLTWIDYSPLNEARVNGTLNTYRKFDIIFRTILDNVVSIGNGKHHYILLPQGNQVFARALLQRAFRELSTGTLNPLMTDPSIFPVMHLLAYIYAKTRVIPVTPYKSDVKLLGKNHELFSNMRSISFFERINPDMFESINFIFQKDDRAIIYNLADLDRFAEDTGFYPKFYRHMMNLRLATSMVPDHVDPDSEQFDTLVSNISGNTETDEEPDVKTVELPRVEKKEVDTRIIRPDYTSSSSEVSKSKIVPKVVAEDTKVTLDEAKPASSFEEKIREAVVSQTPESAPLEPKVISKRQQLIENHLNVTIGGKALGELIQSPPPESIVPKKMDFVKGTPEESYKTSSLLSIDKAYQKHAYHHELAKVVGSLGKHGLFATKVEETKTHTEMDRTTTYKVSLSDVNGKAHHVKFTLPDVDENGLMKLGGIEYRLTRQIANVPICKISPTRVNLSSYYNKVIVERIQSKRNSYEQDMFKLILSLKDKELLKAMSGSAALPSKKVPYDYTAIGRSFTEIYFDSYLFRFGGDSAPVGELGFDKQDKLPSLTKKYGTYVGEGPNESILFWDMSNQIHEVNPGGEIVQSWKSFNHMLVDRIGAEAIQDKTVSEWTQASILNQTIPLVFILAYKFGLKAVLEMIRLDYRFYPQGTRPELYTMDIAIKFSDGVLVFNRYPLSRSLIASGLSWVKLNDISFRDMSVPDTYAKVFAKKDMSVGVLKGLTGFYDFFVDPITETILEKMHEPTTFHELLLRANVMLTDYVAKESSSIALHRFRLYERFNGIVYNEIYRGLANHRNNPTSKKAFSINPEAVFQKIVQDATISPNDVINPVHEIKQKANFTFTGSGGRAADSLVLKDHIYPKDGLGVISESVPDSGKVGITAYLSASPRIDDIHGLAIPYKDGDELDPTNILSIGSMLMPGGTTDDGKRNNYLSIQISHYVPNQEEGETLAVRTGYDGVLPHLVGDTFAVSAEDEGFVEFVDERQKVVRVRYKDKTTEVLRSLKLPYLDNALNSFRDSNKSIGFLIPESQINDYPMGGIFNLSRTTNGKIVDRLRCETVEAIPDKDVARKQNTLIQEFIRGKHKALYYIRFSLMGIKTPGQIKSYSYQDDYSPISGSYLLQKRTPNVKAGDTFKVGDILIYNPGFFVPDPLSKQVTFKHGVIANVALMEKSSNMEDACEISRDLSNKLKMNPCHQREIVTKKDAAILSIVKVGDHVETSDSLCIISDDYLVQSSLNADIENLDIMEKLNRQTPPADYTGIIKKIRILYSCDRDQLSESLKMILKQYEKEVRDNFKALNSNPTIRPPERPGWVSPGTRYQGVEFSDDTVILEFMIEEELGLETGDKLVVGAQLKSIVSHVTEKTHLTESGEPVDMLFSTTGVMARIVASPFLGIAEKNLQKLKSNIIDIYFKT